MDPIVGLMLSIVANAVHTIIEELYRNRSADPTEIPKLVVIEEELRALPIEAAKLESASIDADSLRYAIGNSTELHRGISCYLRYFALDPSSADAFLQITLDELESIWATSGYPRGEASEALSHFLRGALNFCREKYGHYLIAQEHRHQTEMLEKLLKSHEIEFESKLLPYVLVGAWKAGHEKDLELLLQLGAGENPEAFPIAQSSSDKSLFELTADTWRVVSRGALFSRLVPLTTSKQLSEFREVLVSLISERDPSLDLPVDERMYAGARGLVLSLSKQSRDGLARALLHFRSITEFDAPCLRGMPGISSFQGIVNEVACSLLRDSDWKVWASLGPLLPILAEASPDCFLRELERSIEDGNSGVLQLFREGGGAYGGNPHVNLIWAIERLAWYPQYLLKAAAILTRLVDAESDVQIANRPSGSLHNILRPVVSQTLANDSLKSEVLEMIARSYPALAVELLLGILPKLGKRILDQNSRPEALSDYEEPDRAGVDREAYWGRVKHAVRLLTEMLLSPQVLAKLVEELPDLSHPDCIRTIMQKLRDFRREDDEIDGSPCWKALRDLLHWQARTEGKGRSDLDEDILAELKEIYERLIPINPIAKSGWLFCHHPSPPFKTKDIVTDRDEEVIRLRCEALSSIVGSPDAILLLAELVDSAEAPWIIGRVLSLVEVPQEVVSQLLRLEVGDSEKRQQFYQAFCRFVMVPEGMSEAIRQAEEVYHESGDTIRFVRALLGLDPSVTLWEQVESYGDAVDREFWAVYSPFDLNIEQTEFLFASRKLLEYERCPAATLLLSHSLHYSPEGASLPGELQEVVEAVLEQAVDLEVQNELAKHGYDLAEMLRQLWERGFDTDLVFRLEMLLFGALEHSGYQFQAISEHLKVHPKEFAEIVTWIFKAEDEERSEKVDDESRSKWEFGYRFLHRWSGIPGWSDGNLDENYLRSWIDKVLEECAKRGRGRIVLYEIARILKRIPSGSEDQTLHPAAMRFIEETASTTLDEDILVEILNSRGTVSKNLGEGGKQERKLSSEYRAEVDDLSSSFSRTKDILIRVAKDYEEDGKREDIRAEEER